MDAVVYQDPEVIQFVNSNLIPMRMPANDPILGRPFKVKWTPTLLLIDAEGVEHYRIHGFYPPAELIPSLLLGIGKARLNQPYCFGACDCFDKIIADYPNSSLAPEAVYLSGISRFIETSDDTILVGIYDRLAAEYPESPWLSRAEPYRLLKKS
jgi:hypothetical protein